MPNAAMLDYAKRMLSNDAYGSVNGNEVADDAQLQQLEATRQFRPNQGPGSDPPSL